MKLFPKLLPIRTPKVAPRLSLILFTSSILASSLAMGGAAEVKSRDGSSMKFEYEGSDLRIALGDDQGYMILNDDGLFVVRDSDGQLMVIDAGKMMQMFGDMAGSTTPSVATSKVVSLKATGRREDHAGIQGEVYELEYIDETSKATQHAELVLSSDSRAIEFSNAISGMARTIAKSSGKSDAASNEFQQRLQKLNKGVLRYDQDMLVTAISGAKIDSARFVLPAKPTDLSGMAGLADFVSGSTQATTAEQPEQAAEKTGSKGLVGGFLSSFGKKADREQDRAADKADSEVDDATDKAVDSAMDKTFGKLFGR